MPKIFKKSLLDNSIHVEIDHYLAELMQINNISSVGYAIIDKYKIDVADTVTNSEDINVSKNSLFQACSLSKTLTALGILALLEQNKLNIHDPINSQLKSWKIPEHKHAMEINIRRCLSMTSGLCYGEPYPKLPAYTQDKPVPTLKDILNGKQPATNRPVSLYFTPETQYHYSGAGYMVLQQLIEDTANKPFHEFIQENILKPLAMTHSIFQHPLSDELKKDAIPGFNAEGKMLKGGWDNIPSTASGGLWSTPSDLANLALMITNAYLGIDTNLISKNLAIEMLTRQKKSRFGLGVVVDNEEQALNFRKNGHNTGYHNELIMFPNTGQGVVIMTNSASGMSLIKEFVSFIAHRYHWQQSFSLHFDEFNVAPHPICRL